jgi:hypothetical protein
MNDFYLSYYDSTTKMIVLDDRLTGFQKWCTFVHEMLHAYIYEFLPIQFQAKAHLILDVLSSDRHFHKDYIEYWKTWKPIAFKKKGCFIQGTLIDTPKGKVPIESVRIGDKVYCFSDSEEIYTRTVLNTFQHIDYDNELIKIIFDGGELITTTDHFLFREGEFFTAEEFSEGDYLTDKEGNKRKIYSVEPYILKIPIYTLSVEEYPTFIANDIKVHNKGKQKVEFHAYYNWAFAIAEIQCWEKDLIKFTATLGNVIMIGDGIATTIQIPNYWMQKYYHGQGYGYVKVYPLSIKLFRNSLTNELISPTDYTYDYLTGLITLKFTPALGDLIAGTWTYDEEHPKETTVYADFTYKPIYDRIGFKYYKQKDDGLNTYLKTCIRAQYLLSEVYKPIIHGSYDIVYNPAVHIGNSIYISHIVPSVYRIFFIDEIKEQHGKMSHSLEVGGLSFPEIVGALDQYKNERSFGRFDFALPIDMVTFKSDTNYNATLFVSGNVRDLHDSNANDEAYISDLFLKVEKNDETLILPTVPSTFEPNEHYMKSYQGTFSQMYDISFQSGSYPEFTDADVFFAKKLATIEIYSGLDYETRTASEYIFVGRKPLLNKGNTVSFYAGNDHLIFIDTDNDIWLSDWRFVTKKLGTLPMVEAGATQIDLISGYQFIYGVFDGNVEKYDMNLDTWTTIGTLTRTEPLEFFAQGLAVDVSGYHYLKANAEITGTTGNYNRNLYLTKIRDSVITESHTIEELAWSYADGGTPFISAQSGRLYWGSYVYDLDNPVRQAWLGELTPSAVTASFYAQDNEKLNIYTAKAHSPSTDLDLPYASALEWDFYEGVDSKSGSNILMGTLTLPSELVIRPLGAIDGQLVVYVEGAYLATMYHPSTVSGIATVDFDSMTFNLRLAKVEGIADSNVTSMNLNKTLYINWKRYDFQALPILATEELT